MYRYVFFDLDGTLTDSKEGILNCLRYAFEKLGEPVLYPLVRLHAGAGGGEPAAVPGAVCAHRKI